MITETTVLGIALAIDAAVATFAICMLDRQLKTSTRFMRIIILSALFGVFQFLMLWLGSKGGFFLSFSKFGHIFQIVVAAFFMLIGFRLVQESFKEENPDFQWGITSLIILAISTSLDALAAGVSLGVLPSPYLAALEVGTITFVLCFLLSLLTFVTDKIPDRWLLRVAAGVFLFMGLEILVHFFF